MRFFIHSKDCIYEKMNDAFNKLNYYLQKYRNTDYIISDLKITTKDSNGIILYGFYFKVNSTKKDIYIEI
jgi:iron uptake system EfeUOB component EfeO/EfeM